MKSCCQQREHLERLTDETRPDVIILVCRVCGARQIRFRAEPGVIDLSGARMGA